MPQYPVRHQLLLLSLAGVVGAALLAGMAQFSMRAMQADAQQVFAAKDITADILPPPLYLVETRLLLSMAVDGSVPTATARTELQRLRNEYAARIRHWQAQPMPELQPRLMGPQHSEGQQFLDAADGVLDALARGDDASAGARMAVAHQFYLRHRAGVEQTVQAAEVVARRTMDNLVAHQHHALLAGLACLALVMGGLLAVSAAVSRGIRRATGGEPAASAAVARAVAQGDLSQVVPLAPGDNRSAMAAMAQMCRTLGALVGEVRGSSDLIASSAHQIAASSLDLSRRSEQQAAQLQQTATAVTDFRSTVAQAATAADQASALADTACAAARQGASQVGGVVQTMADISQSAQRIAEITGVIDSLAFQTNILALNAAVEAARAGAQGRGFAVVAGEVRALATRSAQAAREIGQLIGQSVASVDSGARQVADAGSTMAEIVGHVERVGGLIGEIHGATRRQTSSIGLVAGAVDDMDSMTQQNVAMVEQTAAATVALSSQAERLRGLMGRFRLPAATT